MKGSFLDEKQSFFEKRWCVMILQKIVSAPVMLQNMAAERLQCTAVVVDISVQRLRCVVL